MRIAFLLIVFLHGLIHLLGFVKGFDIADVKALTLPITKPMGTLWLLAGILFLVYGILFLMDNKFAWLLGFIAVIVSQILIVLFWKDAKFGTLPNIIILLISLVAYGQYNFHKLVQLETNSLLSQSTIFKERVISASEINELPAPVKKWLQLSGAVGKPYIRVGKVIQQAEMKMKPGQQNWMPASATQYTFLEKPAFIWTVDGKMNAFLNFQGRDKFTDGKGEMLIKLNSLINVVNEQGEKLNEGSLQRFLGEMVWFPSLALSEYISWEQLNDTTARATLNYKGSRGSGTFYFNEQGDFIRFSAMRYKDNIPDAKRYEWVLEVKDYRIFEGIKVPSKMTTTWKLDKEDWTWLNLEIVDIKYNENARR